jgi:hypothetical protein
MADDTIGQVSVSITGDYSGLEKDFQTSIDLAQAAGQQIGASLEAGAAGANTLTAAVNSTAAAFDAAGAPASDLDARMQALFDQGMTLSEALAAINSEAKPMASSLDGAAASAESAGAAATTAAAGVAQVGQAAGQAAPQLNQAAEASNGLAASFLELAGAAVTARALQQIGEDSIEAYGKVQQLTTSLDLMGAGAEGAAEKVDQLKALSVQLAVPFEDLAGKAQALAAQFGTGEGLTAVLIAAGNAAAATGKSFDASAGALERIGVTGSVTARQLFALGLSWQDMANSMGVSIADAEAKLKKGGQDSAQDVADTIDAINAKFGNAAELQAANTLGVLTNLKNQATFIFQSLGEDLAPILDVFSGAMKVIATGFELFIGGIKLSVDAVIGLVLQGIEGLKGLGAVAADVATGKLAQVPVDIANMMAATKAISQQTDANLLKDAIDTGNKLESIWSGTAQKITAAFSGAGSGGGSDATTFSIKQTKDMSDAVAVLAAMEKQETAAKQAVINETAKYNEANNTLISSSDLLFIQLMKAGDAIRAIGDAVAPADTHLGDLESETNKLYSTMNRLRDGIAETQQQTLDTTSWGKMDSALKTLGLSTDDLATKSRAAKVAAAEFIAANSDSIPQVTVSWEVLNSEISRLAKVNLPEAIAMQNDLITSMQRTAAPMGQIYDAEEKLLTLEIQLAGERGQSANSQIIALENLKVKTQALSDVNNFLGNTYVSLMKDVDSAFTTLGNDVASSIVQGKGFSAGWHTALQSIETQILGTLISAVVKLGGQWVITQLLGTTASTTATAIQIAGIGKVAAAQAAATAATVAQIATVAAAQTTAIAAYTAAQTGSIAAVATAQTAAFLETKIAASLLDVSEVLGEAAVGGAAAAASTAAIPIIGPELAPEAGAAMYAIIAGTYGPLATFSEGGMVPEDMIALVHKGEYVLSAEKTAAASVGGNTGAGDTHLHFDFSGAHFTGGITDGQVRDIFNRGIRSAKLAGAFPPGRFPQ